MYVEHTDNNELIRCSTVELNKPNVVELSKLDPLFINYDMTNNKNLFTANVCGEDGGEERGKDEAKDGDKDQGEDEDVGDDGDEDGIKGEDTDNDGADSSFNNGDDIPNLDVDDDRIFDENVVDKNAKDLGSYMNVETVNRSNMGIEDYDEDLHNPYESDEDHIRYSIYKKDYELDDPFNIGLVFDDTK